MNYRIIPLTTLEFFLKFLVSLQLQKKTRPFHRYCQIPQLVPGGRHHVKFIQPYSITPKSALKRAHNLLRHTRFELFSKVPVGFLQVFDYVNR